jgi:hypothetical protein
MSELSVFDICSITLMILFVIGCANSALKNRNIVTSWKGLLKVGSLKVISAKEFGGNCAMTYIKVSLANDSNREIIFKNPRAQAFDKEGFVIHSTLITDTWECTVPRNSKVLITLGFVTTERSIRTIRIWNHDIEIAPEMFSYQTSSK